MKVDLVMWTKNGEAFLPKTLERIDSSIPSENVKDKILVDDLSIDRTVEIAKDFNWIVYLNPSTGISAGANEALRHVNSKFFASFEQDLLLAKNWWTKISRYHRSPQVGIASGVRFVDKPTGLRKLQEYKVRRRRGETKLQLRLGSAKGITASDYIGKTTDNTIYKTDLIKALGGFPKGSHNIGVASILAHNIERAGYRWVIDYEVQSTHLRHGLERELQHVQWYGSMLRELSHKIQQETAAQYSTSKLNLFLHFAISPATGLLAALEEKEASIIYIHTLMHLYYMRGVLKGN